MRCGFGYFFNLLKTSTVAVSMEGLVLIGYHAQPHLFIYLSESLRMIQIFNYKCEISYLNIQGAFSALEGCWMCNTIFSQRFLYLFPVHHEHTIKLCYFHFADINFRGWHISDALARKLFNFADINFRRWHVSNVFASIRDLCPRIYTDTQCIGHLLYRKVLKFEITSEWYNTRKLIPAQILR